jgi:hypothetical protein
VASHPESWERSRSRDLALGADVGAAGAARPAKVILHKLAVTVATSDFMTGKNRPAARVRHP